MKHLKKSRHTARFSQLFLGLAGLACTTILPFQSAQADDYVVDINKTQMLRLDKAASAVVIGNPEIADISVHSPNLLLIVGRGYGTTNLIVLDDLGQTIINETIHVRRAFSPSNRRVLVVGKGWQSYNCSPMCQPAPVHGDDPSFVDQYTPTGQSINNTGVPATVTPFTASGASSNTGPISFAYSPNQQQNSGPQAPFPGPPANSFPFGPNGDDK